MPARARTCQLWCEAARRLQTALRQHEDEPDLTQTRSVASPLPLVHLNLNPDEGLHVQEARYKPFQAPQCADKPTPVSAEPE